MISSQLVCSHLRWRHLNYKEGCLFTRLFQLLQIFLVKDLGSRLGPRHSSNLHLYQFKYILDLFHRVKMLPYAALGMHIWLQILQTWCPLCYPLSLCWQCTPIPHNYQTRACFLRESSLQTHASFNLSAVELCQASSQVLQRYHWPWPFLHCNSSLLTYLSSMMLASLVTPDDRKSIMVFKKQPVVSYSSNEVEYRAMVIAIA